MFRMLFLSLSLLALFTPSFATACSSSSPCDTTEFCTDAVNGICQPVVYNPIHTPVASISSSTSAPFSIAFVSDAQFYYTTCKNNPKDFCLYDPATYTYPSANEEKRELDRAAIRQLDCINTLAISNSFTAVFDGGDLTNVGRDVELARLETYHEDLKKVAPLAFMLGNHDYAYTLSDGTRYTDENVLRMLDYFVRNIKNVPNVLSVDYHRADDVVDASRDTGTRYTGSMSYTVEINDYVFFMLHWSAAIGKKTFSRKIDGTDPLSGKRVYYDIVPVTKWFEEELVKANNRNKKIVLFPHSKKALQAFIKVPSVVHPSVGELRKFLQTLPIVAILSGHDHDAWGLQPNLMRIGRSRIPVVYGGSLSYQTLVLLQFAGNGGGVTATPYDSRDGSLCQATGFSDTT